MKKAFITGATGFIGGRLAEVLCSQGYEVVALVRTWSKAARLARLSAKMLPGNVLEIESLRKAMDGCDVVFHCAVDNSVGGEAHKRVSVEGTKNVLQVAKDFGMQRVIHLSSAAVFGYKPVSDVVSEETPTNYSNDCYCDGKIDSEKVAMDFFKKHDLPVVILRPTIVYGPYGDYSSEMVRLLKENRMVLVDSGKGICNTLYVDNLIEAMMLAAKSDKAVGEIIHISDAEKVLWHDFIKGHANALGESVFPIHEKPIDDIKIVTNVSEGNEASSFRQLFRVIRDPKLHEIIYSIPIIKRTVVFIKKFAAEKLTDSTRARIREVLFGQKRPQKINSSSTANAAAVLLNWEFDMITAFHQTQFPIDKARNLLGFEPQVNLAEGIKRTSAWIKWARL